MTRNGSEAKNPVKSTLTTFDVLEALDESDGARVTALAERLDLPKSSVHNYLSTLRQRGYVVKRGDEYHVGLRFLGLGVTARNKHPVCDIAKPEVRTLAEETGELANLMVEEHGMGVYVHRETGEDAVRVDADTGHRVHLHNTALGKAILAHYPRERVDAVLDRHGMPQTSDRTITDRGELFDELEAVRENGVAFDDEERLDGLRCVASPILDSDGEPLGAVSVSGPKRRMSAERFREEVPGTLRDAVNIIELNVAHS
ncbi:IclR family transcriptional regulator [Halobacterium sp. R2-5]|uniref:IclR family transcriptional regulator n=1 Tax=Halobacterium sp. R2-5 TaxID=2715751 RepID=UPI001423DDE1|nr:IclR family transcriptional regulator [Halobacterium sp. R2-5]NIC00737.1 IclR family transcriptional regulator [Halobacterium sp. R2-5]